MYSVPNLTNIQTKSDQELCKLITQASSIVGEYSRQEQAWRKVFGQLVAERQRREVGDTGSCYLF